MAERGEGEHLDRLLEATWDNPVFDDTFQDDSERLGRVKRQMAAIALRLTPEFAGLVREGMEASDDDIQALLAEILPKTLAFCPALTEANLDDVPNLSELALCVSLMYLGNQSIGRGDHASEQACALLGMPITDTLDAATILRLGLYSQIEAGVDYFALEEDRPFVLPRFYEDVLRNDVWLQGLSRGYTKTDMRYMFLEQHAAELAERTTINAGFPSITASLYAIYRQHDDTLPPLAQVDADPVVTKLLQVCNVVARLWDNIGDWEKDNGSNGRDEFVINPFSQYHPDFVRRFAELAHMDQEQTAALDCLTEHFSRTRDVASEDMIMELLRQHIRTYVDSLPAETHEQFGLYIDLCKRVMEISWVNRIGDVALTAPIHD